MKGDSETLILKGFSFDKLCQTSQITPLFLKL